MIIRSRWENWRTVTVGLLFLFLVALALWIVRIPRLPAGAIVVPRDVETLQDALDRAAPRDVIVLLPSVGTVHGSLSIEIPGITVMSWRGRTSWVAPGEPVVLTLAADGVAVRGISVSSEDTGILVLGSDNQIEDADVQAAIVGIELRGAVRCTVASVRVDAGRIGLLVGEGSSQSLLVHGTVLGGSDAGILLRNVDGIRIRTMTLRAAQTGILVEDAQDVVIECAHVEAAEKTGIRMDRTVQSCVSESTVSQSQQSGIVLSDGRENAIVSNRVSACGASGLLIEQSRQTLVHGNVISNCADGIRIDRSAAGRLLRNAISDSRRTGLLLVRGESHQVLDNVISGGDHGILSIESVRSVLLRNAITSTHRGGISVLHSRGEQQVVENTVSSCAWGLLGLAAEETLFSGNAITKHRLGIWLIGSVGRLHVDGNLVARNGVGLKWQRDPSEIEEDLRLLGVSGLIERPSDPPLLTRNLFQSNDRYDIETEGVPSLYAGGNWWGTDRIRDPDRAVVSDGVSLKTSAWRGSVAIGAGPSTVDLLLGTILKQVLIGAEYQVVDLVGLESSQHVLQALEDADVDIIWLRPSHALLDVLPLSDETVLWRITSVMDGWRLAISPALLGAATDRTLSSLSAVCTDRASPLRAVCPPPWTEQAFEELLQSYGLSGCLETVQTPGGLGEAETLLKLGTADVAIVPRLEETLSLSGFVLLEDDRHVLLDQPLLLGVRRETLQRFPELEPLMAEMEARLTSTIVHQLVSQIRLLRKDVEEVARDHLSPPPPSNE
jgi:parallel beta-helix repeat protein